MSSVCVVFCTLVQRNVEVGVLVPITVVVTAAATTTEVRFFIL